MFLKPYRSTNKIYMHQKPFLIWWPFAVISFNTCYNSYLIDLMVVSEIEDPLPLILTMRRYKRNHPLEPSPPIDAPIMIPRSAGPNIVINQIYKIRQGVMLGGGRETSEEPLRHRSYWRQIESREPNTLEEAVSNPISRRILSEILSAMCIDDNNIAITSYNPVHILAGISRDMREFNIYMDKKVRSVNHEIYVLTNERIRSMIESYMRTASI